MICAAWWKPSGNEERGASISILPRKPPIAASASAAKSSSFSDSQPAASSFGTDQTIAERWPTAVVVHRQQRERPGRIENLIGDMLVRPLVPKHRDDRLVIVLPPRDIDPGGFARRRIAAVGGNQQRAPKLAAVLERNDDAVIAAIDTRVTRDFHSSQRFLPASARAWSAARRLPVLVHEAERLVIVGIEVKPARLQPVGDRDPPDRAARLGQMVGDADRLQHAHRARRDGAGASVERGIARAAPGRRDRRRSTTARSNRAPRRAPGRPARRRR